MVLVMLNEQYKISVIWQPQTNIKKRIIDIIKIRTPTHTHSHHSHSNTEQTIDVRLTANEEKLENKSLLCNMFSLTILMIIK